VFLETHLHIVSCFAKTHFISPKFVMASLGLRRWWRLSLYIVPFRRI